MIALSLIAGMTGALLVELALWLVKRKPWRRPSVRGGDSTVLRDPILGQFSVRVKEPT